MGFLAWLRGETVSGERKKAMRQWASAQGMQQLRTAQARAVQHAHQRNVQNQQQATQNAMRHRH
jgi:hypothetical protein